MYHISLTSNASTDYFPNNTPSSYRVKMPHIFKSTNRYECALSDIIFPNKLKNVRKGLNFIEVEDKGETKEYAITPGYYSTIEVHVLKIKNTINLIEINYNKVEKRTFVKTNNPIKFGQDIARLLGFSSNTWIDGGGKKIKSPYHATVYGGLTTLYVYTDVIEEQFIGEQQFLF